MTMKTFAFFLFVILAPSLASAQHITVNGNQFQVDGKRIWISGANTPWKNWNEFGNNFDAFAKGWQGIMPWTSDGMDDNGNLSNMRPALEWLAKSHADLILPVQ